MWYTPEKLAVKLACQLPLCRNVILMVSLLVFSMFDREKPMREYKPEKK